MVRSYEELIGALGRGVFFRPERRRAREWLSPDAEATLRVDGRTYPVFDLSMNGVSFLADDPPENWPADREVDLTLLLHGDVEREGSTRVARVKI